LKPVANKADFEVIRHYKEFYLEIWQERLDKPDRPDKLEKEQPYISVSAY
jgi:hypothetical protein